jgi:hypothetical protein|tara:strand:+ start:4427 stop:5470 length:1044 start_codon:yes stop_codon:yes gene_type:complete
MSFKRFDQDDIVISAESVTSPIWSGDKTTLSSFFTSSTQTGGASGQYYFDIFQTQSSVAGAKTQFSIAFADRLGRGGVDFNPSVSQSSPTSTIYGQYRSLVLGDEEASFNFGGVSSDNFWALAIDRSRFKEKLLPGTLDLILEYSGSDGKLRNLRLTDDSKAVSTVTFNDAGRVFELCSGSLGDLYTTVNSNGYSFESGSYGKLLPDIGVILINNKAVSAATGSTGGGLGIDFPVTLNANADGGNNRTLYNAIVRGANFRVQSEETISSNFVFVRVKNSEFNYSTNPSLITGSGELRHNVMIDTPQSYITQVGLFNDNNDLLAVAKLSRPLLKDFTKEALIRIKLDY